MANKNGVPYRVWLVPSSKYKLKAPYSMNPKKITYHNTDNQMPAQNEISYMRNNNNQTSYHVAVDEKEAIQGLPFNRNGWHSGDGGRGYGNRNTIGIEICRNYDRARRTTNLIEPLKSQYSQAEINAVKVGAQIMYEQGIAPTLNNIKFHQEWSGKNCPSKILNERRGSAFKALAVAEAVRYKAKMEGRPVPANPNIPTPKPVTPSGGKSIDTLVNETLAGLHGNGDARKKSLGSNFDAVQGRINAMYGGGGTPSKTTQQLVNEVLAGKHGNGEARKKSLGSRFDEVQNAINKGSSTGSTRPAPRKTTQQLVNEVIAGKHGHGEARKKSLGSRYDEVQNAINKGTTSSKPAPSRKTTAQLVKEVMDGKHGHGDARKKSLGSRYNEVQNAINKGSTGSSSSRKTTQQLVREVMQGKHGHGNARKKSLGSRYDEVQNAINRGMR